MTESPDPNAMPGSSPTPAGPPPGPMGVYQAPPTGPMGGYQPPPSMAPKRSNRLALVILVIIAVVIVAAVGWVFLNRDSLIGEVDLLQVGDCIDEPPQADVITEVQHQPCNTPHDGEVFASLTNPAGPDEPYPVVSGFDDYIQTNCIPLFEAYTGRTWATDTDFDISYLHPTLEGWTGDQHDRGFTCYLTRFDSGKLYGPVKGIGASPLPTQKP